MAYRLDETQHPADSDRGGDEPSQSGIPRNFQSQLSDRFFSRVQQLPEAPFRIRQTLGRTHLDGAM
jgi:hypothetical protein